MAGRRVVGFLLGSVVAGGAAMPADAEPSAAAVLAPGFGTAPLTVAFDGTASVANTPASVLVYTWDFGDGTVGTGPAPHHTYDEPGTYEVRLTVSEVGGAVESPYNTSFLVLTVAVVDPPRAPFADIGGSFAVAAIDALFAKGIVAGATPNTFNPGAVVTRAEAAVMLVRTVEAVRMQAAGSASGGFNFVDITAHPLVTFVRRAADLGLTVGTTPTTFEPSTVVDRAQAAVFIVRLYEALSGTSPPAVPTPFTDLEGGYADPFIAQAYGLRVTTGIGPDTYDPHGPVTREQMVQLVLRTLLALP